VLVGNPKAALFELQNSLMNTLFPNFLKRAPVVDRSRKKGSAFQNVLAAIGLLRRGWEQSLGLKVLGPTARAAESANYRTPGNNRNIPKKQTGKYRLPFLGANVEGGERQNKAPYYPGDRPF